MRGEGGTLFVSFYDIRELGSSATLELELKGRLKSATE